MSKITAGENRAHTLVHDFVVLNYCKQKGASNWKITLPTIGEQGSSRQG